MTAIPRPDLPVIFRGQDALTNANPTVHTITGVEKLHERGIKGKGAVVGVIDTGTSVLLVLRVFLIGLFRC